MSRILNDEYYHLIPIHLYISVYTIYNIYNSVFNILIDILIDEALKNIFKY